LAWDTPTDTVDYTIGSGNGFANSAMSVTMGTTTSGDNGGYTCPGIVYTYEFAATAIVIVDTFDSATGVLSITEIPVSASDGTVDGDYIITIKA